MRIRKCASKLLGATYCSTPAPLPPPPHLAPPRAAASACGDGGASGSSAATSGVFCELSRSPWDLIAELDFSNPQEDFDDKYFVNISGRPSWLRSGVDVKAEDGVIAESSARHVVVKKAAKKKGAGKAAKVMKEEGDDYDAAVVTWTCKKNDGKRWHCTRPTSQPNSLCDYHLAQSRSYYNPYYDGTSPAASAVASSSKARKRKPSDDVGGSNADFYYYTGFGPFRGKRRGRSEVVDRGDDSAARNDEWGVPEDELCDIAGIAGGDEESDDDDDSCIGNDGRQAVDVNSKSAVEKKSSRKRGRKPVKARSLKSLL